MSAEEKLEEFSKDIKRMVENNLFRLVDKIYSNSMNSEFKYLYHKKKYRELKLLIKYVEEILKTMKSLIKSKEDEAFYKTKEGQEYFINKYILNKTSKKR